MMMNQRHGVPTRYARAWFRGYAACRGAGVLGDEDPPPGVIGSACIVQISARDAALLVCGLPARIWEDGAGVRS